MEGPQAMGSGVDQEGDQGRRKEHGYFISHEREQNKDYLVLIR